MDKPSSKNTNPTYPHLTSMPTDMLRQRLNSLYSSLHHHPNNPGQLERFDHLWDIKEMALLEGRNCVEVPDLWLDELERLSRTNSQPNA